VGRVLLHHVSKRFESVVAVDDLTLEVQDEEFLVLVGPSGCGKTTALRMIAGLEDVSSGNIAIGERRVDHLPPRDRDIAMVFQSYALYPHMSVFDNMAFGLKLHHVPKVEIRRRVTETAQTLGIGSLLDRKPRQLSGGQRQRVALGRAIVREPQAFLMDEPLSNLDAKLRVETRAQIIKLHQRLRTTTIYVTHDQVEAMTMGDRIAVMRDGVLQQLDTPQGLYDEPANVFVAGFIGSPAMNLFPMAVTDGANGLALVADGMQVPVPAHLREGLRPHQGKACIAGIRPEDVRVEPPDGLTAAALRARVDVVEPLGSDAYLYLIVGSSTLIARVGGRTPVRAGEDLTIWLDTRHLHAFDAETERSVQSDAVTARS
jgi:multiple sugar transport system ATP-binding protein